MVTDHLSETVLVRLALDGGDDAHLATCAICAGELEQLRLVVGRLRALPDPPQRLVDAATAFYRRRRSLEALLERLTDDTAFRARAKAKPEEVLREAGLEPLPELIDALRQTGRGSAEAAQRIAAKLWP